MSSAVELRAQQDAAANASMSAACSNVLPQQYCLRWNNHQHNLLSVFETLLRSEAFVDVTLACDGFQLKAHKMVLSACSPYFQALLYNTQDRHPIVLMRDVRLHEMRALLDFMYKGEVSVDQENLSSLLKVAEGLQIKGLAEVGGSSETKNAAAVAAAYPYGVLSQQQSTPPPPPPSASSSILPGDKRIASPPAATSTAAYVGPKRKRAKPRRLSGSEAVPMASGLTDGEPLPRIHERSESLSSKASSEEMIKTESENTNTTATANANERMMLVESAAAASHLHAVAAAAAAAAAAHAGSVDAKLERGLRGARERSQSRDSSKPLDLISEADSNDGRSSGLLSPKKLSSWHSPTEPILRPASTHSEPAHSPSSSSPQTSSSSSLLLRVAPSVISSASSPTGNHSPASSNAAAASTTSVGSAGSPPAERGGRGAAAVAAEGNNSSTSAARANSHSSNSNNSNNHSLDLRTGRGRRGRFRGRSLFRGRNNSERSNSDGTPGERTGTKSFSEMSVRGLDLLRYATIGPDGSYRCIECERVQLSRNFKNKYSFQRHAFLYHEGCERKVFPCPICQKEFSRPDKMKSHLKTAHDFVLPKPESSSAATTATATATTTARAKNAAAAAASAAATATTTTTASNATAMANAAAAAVAAAQLGPSALLVNPFLNPAGLKAGRETRLRDRTATAAEQQQAMAAAASMAAMGVHHSLFNLGDPSAAVAAAREAAAAAAAAEMSPPQTRVRQRLGDSRSSH